MGNDVVDLTESIVSEYWQMLAQTEVVHGELCRYLDELVGPPDD